MPNGETSVATVRIWNETVSNLTLMALGSSAPEILLSVIEVNIVPKSNVLNFHVDFACLKYSDNTKQILLNSFI